MINVPVRLSLAQTALDRRRQNTRGPKRKRTIAIGVLNSCPIHPREVFKPAIISNSAGVVLIHNHPSGESLPSRDDLEMTKRLTEAGEILGIPVVDHVILGEGNFVSLRERGQL